jgi:thimet oligopeptidase
MSVDSAARLLTSTPEELTQAAEAAIAAARAGVEAVKRAGPDAEPLATLDRYDEAMASLSTAIDRAGLVSQCHPDQAMRDAADAAKQAVSKVRTDVALDRELYDALAGLDVAAADPATRHFVARTLRDFRRAGVDRDDATRARVRELSEELVRIGQDFLRNISSDTRTAELAPEALAGLPEDFVRAHPPGDDGLVRVSTDYPDLVPVLTYATDAGAREQLWRLFNRRGHPSNVGVLRRMLERRHELARVLGYSDWAAYAAEDKMIGAAENIADFIERIAAAAAERAARDYAVLLERKRVDDPTATAVFPWDASYLDDRVKAEQFAFDTQAMRPYLEYGRVKAGLMGVIERLFGVRFIARTDIPVWHPEVECFEVMEGERLVGRIFLDMHPRPDKFRHAAMFTMTMGKAPDRVPECALLCNLPRPGAQPATPAEPANVAQPALLQHIDVRTFFHEFGHLIHHIFAGHGRWSGTNGISTEWDFVEAPSQLLEEWTRDARTLAGFAVHHETGEPLPADLVAAMRAAEEVGKGLFVRQQMFYASMAFELYRRDPDGLDPVNVEREARERLTPYRHVDGTFVHLAFGHLDGYSAVYCTYMWSLVIAKDLFTAFAAEGLDSAGIAARYRDTVLAPGGSAPAAELVERFLGRPYDFAAYQAWLDEG